MTHVACESKLPTLDGNPACGRVYTWAAHAFNAGINVGIVKPFSIGLDDSSDRYNPLKLTGSPFKSSPGSLMLLVITRELLMILKQL